jgi:hypothetical protein
MATHSYSEPGAARLIRVRSLGPSGPVYAYFGGTGVLVEVDVATADLLISMIHRDSPPTQGERSGKTPSVKALQDELGVLDIDLSDYRRAVTYGLS